MKSSSALGNWRMIYPRFEEYNFSPWGHLERRKSPHSVIFQLEHRVDRPEDDPQAQLAMFPNILFQLTAMLDLNRQVAPPPSCHTIVLCVCVYVSQCVCVWVGGSSLSSFLSPSSSLVAVAVPMQINVIISNKAAAAMSWPLWPSSSRSSTLLEHPCRYRLAEPVIVLA